MNSRQRYERLIERNAELRAELDLIDRIETAAGRNFLDHPDYIRLRPALAANARAIDALETSLRVFGD